MHTYFSGKGQNSYYFLDIEESVHARGVFPHGTCRARDGVSNRSSCLLSMVRHGNGFTLVSRFTCSSTSRRSTGCQARAAEGTTIFRTRKSLHAKAFVASPARQQTLTARHPYLRELAVRVSFSSQECVVECVKWGACGQLLD